MNLSLICDNPIFHGIPENEMEELLNRLGAAKKVCEKDCCIFHRGDVTEQMGIVLSGGINIIRTDIRGRQSILDHISPGQVFAETYACLGDEPLMVDAVAAEKSEILLLKPGKAAFSRTTEGDALETLFRNLLYIMARKNLNLTQKINHITPKTIRERIESFLLCEAVKRRSCEFDIPFNRQQMADYLLVDRSALSAELSRMQKEGILAYRKNHFRLEENYVEAGTEQ